MLSDPAPQPGAAPPDSSHRTRSGDLYRAVAHHLAAHPDALLKVGYSQLELKQTDAAKATLQALASKYPGSKAAGLAQERLRRLQLQSAN